MTDRDLASRALALPLALGLVGCGPGMTNPQAEMREVCGQDGPVQLVSLKRGETGFSTNEIVEGDTTRLVYTLSSYRAGAGGIPQLELQELWSVGPCGEEPSLLAEGLVFWNRFPAGDDLVMGCDEDRAQLYALDPSGRRPAKRLEGVPCGDVIPGHGILERGDGISFGPLVLWRLAADPWSNAPEPLTLADDAFLGSGLHVPTPRGPLVDGDDAFVILSDDRLARVDLHDAGLSVIAERVESFDVSPDWVAWQTTDAPQGPTHVSLRASGEQLEIEGVPGLAPASVMSPGAIAMETDSGLHIFDRLPSNASFVLPPDWELARWVEDRTYLVVDEGGALRRWDFETSTGSTLLEPAGERWPWRDDDDATRWHMVEHGPPETWQQVEGPLWEVRLDGNVTLLAERATRGWRQLGDGRVLSRVDLSSDGRGDLVVVDAATLEESFVDADVSAFVSTSQTLPHDVFYWVFDDDRTGLWRAALTEP